MRWITTLFVLVSFIFVTTAKLDNISNSSSSSLFIEHNGISIQKNANGTFITQDNLLKNSFENYLLSELLEEKEEEKKNEVNSLSFQKKSPQKTTLKSPLRSLSSFELDYYSHSTIPKFILHQVFLI